MVTFSPSTFKKIDAKKDVKVTLILKASTTTEVTFTGTLHLRSASPGPAYTYAEPLSLTIVVHNQRVPPDPGETGKQTVEGIDSDHDGLRDDVQRFILLTYFASDGIVLKVYEALSNAATGQPQRGTLVASSAVLNSDSINQEPNWYNNCRSFETAGSDITEDCFTATFAFPSSIAFLSGYKYLVLFERTGSPLPLFNNYILSGRSSFDFPTDPENAQVRCEEDGDCEVRNNGAPVYTIWR
jgi:hypothetical protein